MRIRAGRMSMDHLFIHEVELFRKKKVRNPAGGFTEKWVKIDPKLVPKVRISTYTPRENEKIQNEKQQYPMTHRIYAPATMNIQADDRIRYRGEVLEVQKPQNPSFLNHHLEMYARILSVAEMGDMDGQ